MLLNYLKLAIRLLIRNPFSTTINVLGLAIGFASFFALWEYSTSELKSDQYHKDSGRIARIGLNYRWTEDGGNTWGKIVLGVAKASLFPRIVDDYPDVESYLRILNQSLFKSDLVGHGNKIIISIDNEKNQQQIFKEEKAAYADSNLFNFFSIPLVYGQPDKVLSEVNFVVLSHSTSLKYFGEIDPTGELLKLNDSTTLKVSGVFEDLPHYSHLDFDFVISNIGLENKWLVDTWGAMCYVKLNHTNFTDFQTKLNEKTSQYWAEILQNFPQVKLDMFVQPLSEISFSQSFYGDNFYPKSKTFLFTLAFIGISVLTMAWVNYINSSATRITRRLKEVATRKVSGAASADIVSQFVTESFVTNLLAIALSFTLIQIIRSPVSILFNIEIAKFLSLNISSIAIFLSIITVGILLSGLYPALISLAYPARVLFNISSVASGKRLIPSMLTVSQITVAIVFIILGFAVSLQLRHILNMDTGISKDHVVVIEAPILKPLNYASLLTSLKNQISGNRNAESVALSRFVFSGNGYDAGTVHLRRIGADLFFGIDENTVDVDYIALYGIKLLAGRNFVKDNQANGILISRFAATRLGFKSPNDAVGAVINMSENDLGIWEDAEVIGVFEDFRVASFLNMSQSSSEYSDRGRGIVLRYEDHSRGVPEKISVKISPEKFEETIHEIQALYEQQFQGNIFTWYFLDDHTNQVYAHEKVARNQVVLFTALALFIACLGLFGMITSKAVEKTKEIGIRKVMGAQLHQIAQILLNTTAKHIMVATAIGIPVAYYLTQQYLQKFSARITLQWWHYAVPVGLLLLIMVATITSVVWKASRTNPVESLRYE